MTYTNIAVLTTPRTGSNLLFDVLSQCFGAPRFAEFFQASEQMAEQIYRIFGREVKHCNLKSYIARLKDRHATQQGLFFYKLLFCQLNFFRESEALSDLVRQSHWIFLTRKDLVAQAVSHHRAEQDNQWVWKKGEDLDNGEERKVEYSFQGIRRSFDRIVEGQTGWEVFFRKSGVAPLRLTYEDFSVDFDGTIQQIEEAFSISVGRKFDRDAIQLNVQRNEETAQWCERFQEEYLSTLKQMPSGLPEGLLRF